MTAAGPTILASCGGLVGGDWTDAAYGPLLFEAIRLARVPADRRPRVLHVNTAGGDQRFVEGQELEAARVAGVDAAHLRFFPRRNVPSLRDAVLRADVVWVSGGSLVGLLAVWRAHGLDELLRAAWQAGVVLAGGSAGGICWHAGGVTQSFGPEPRPVTDGLGFVPGSLGVHTDSDPRRLPAYRAAIDTGVLPGGIAVDEGVGLVYTGRELAEVVTERAAGRALRLGRDAPDELLPARLLPGSAPNPTPTEDAA